MRGLVMGISAYTGSLSGTEIDRIRYEATFYETKHWHSHFFGDLELVKGKHH
jgi:Uri superfamily endonuclease